MKYYNASYITYSSSTSSAADDYIYRGEESKPKMATKMPNKPHKPKLRILKTLAEEKLIHDNLLMVTNHGSEVVADRRELEWYGIYSYIFDPLSRRCFEAPLTGRYDTALIMTILELIPNLRSRANVVKESLLSLAKGKSRAVTIVSRTKELVKKQAEENGWGKAGDRYVAPFKTLDREQLTISGLDKQELIDLSGLAGAKSIWEPEITFEGFDIIMAS